MKTLLTTFSMAAAMSLAVAAPMAAAQQSGNQTNAARNAQVNNQRILQEQAQGTGAPLHISPAVVRQIKQALNEAGYDLGHVDGNWGKQARKGLRNYQQAQGLAPTGQLNVATLRTLGVNVLRMQQNGPAGQAANQAVMQGGASQSGGPPK
ncbi:MAG TPA: peptidoglycan-binding domain-containing protein [Gammaproteobacteria bacterium]|nr:peptidoglycan-binding domain-containing protein [Gammaproteobacteria bacterium]